MSLENVIIGHCIIVTPSSLPPSLPPSLPLLSTCSHDGQVYLLTKGDNNQVDDRGLYAPGQLWVKRDEVVGRARG